MRKALIALAVAAAAIAAPVASATTAQASNGCTTTYAGKARATPLKPGSSGVTAYVRAQGANTQGYLRCAI